MAYVIVGDRDYAKFMGGQPSIRLRKALELADQGSGLQILTEAEFLAMVRS